MGLEFCNQPLFVHGLPYWIRTCVKEGHPVVAALLLDAVKENLARPKPWEALGGWKGGSMGPLLPALGMTEPQAPPGEVVLRAGPKADPTALLPTRVRH